MASLFRKVISQLILLLSCSEGFSQVQYQNMIIREVYNNLVSSIGDERKIPPTLVISNEKRNVAVYSPLNNTIEFELAAYDVCHSLGKDSLNAVAFILSHELAHHYKEHGFIKKMGTGFLKGAFSNEIDDEKNILDSLGIFETEADVFGGFYSQMAGYNSLLSVDSLLTDLYKAYNIPAKIPNYPSLNERIDIGTYTLKLIKQLSAIFDVGFYSLLSANYQLAQVCFEQIINQQFTSREIYNNLGVTYFMESLQFFPADSFHFIYPVGFDSETRLVNQIQRSIEEDFYRQRKENLLKANQYFEISISLDKKYTPAYINLACSNLLLFDFEETSIWLSRLKKNCDLDSATLASIKIIEGIQLYIQGDSIIAIEKFTTALGFGSEIAKINLQNLVSKDKNLSEAVKSNLTVKIDEVNFDNLLLQFNAPYEKIKMTPITIKQKEFPNSVVYSGETNESGNQYTSFFQVSKPFLISKTGLPFNIGDVFEIAEKRSGTPDQIIRDRKNIYLIYQQNGLIIKGDKKVSAIILFRNIF